MRTEYIYDQGGWPAFRMDLERLARRVSAVRFAQGRLIGRMEGGGRDLQHEVSLRNLTEDVVRTSEIEGVVLDVEQVRAALARRLGVRGGKRTAHDVEGVVEMAVDAVRNFGAPMTAERLCAWDSLLLEREITGWRQSSVQVVSGPMGRERVHFEAPPPERVPEEMSEFLRWFEADERLDGVLKAGVAHLWFATIHPFEDGNGRIARAVADLALARSERTGERFYSLAAQIREERRSYHEVLERVQQGGLDVTEWLEWFLDCVGRAIERSRVWAAIAATDLNERQRAVLLRVVARFEGKLTSSKWAEWVQCSQDTAHRDIVDLVSRGMLVQNAEGGRSTSYSLAAGSLL